MNDEVIVKRYADAFLADARENIGFEKGLEELRGMKKVLNDNPIFKTFMERPDINNQEKYFVIDKTLAEDFSEETRNFLKLLLNKRRINQFNNIAEYARVNYAHGGEVDAVLKVSCPLDTALIDDIKAALEKRFNKKLHLHVELDPGLLGGLYARIGNMIIDGSIKKRLEDMKEKLLGMRVVHDNKAG